MTDMSITSLRAFRSVELAESERLVMQGAYKNWPDGQWFTRGELAKRMEWPINRITGRVFTLLEKGYLQQDKGRTVRCNATGGDAHPIRIKPSGDTSARGAQRPSKPENAEFDSPSPLQLHAVKPVFEKHRMSMTPEQAEKLLAHPNAKDCDQYGEACRVLASGRYWVEL